MKKFAAIVVVALVAAAAWFMIQNKSAQVCGKTELALLTRCAPTAPAIFVGVAQDETILRQFKADKGYADFVDALKTSPAITQQFSQFLGALPPEAKKLTDSIVDPKNPVGAVLEMTVDNLVAAAFYMPAIDFSKDDDPEFLGVLTLRHTSKIPEILDQIKGFEHKTVAGKQAYACEDFFICVAGKRVVFSNSEKLAAALFEALDGKLPASALPDNPRFQKLAKGCPDSTNIVFCDFSAITLKLSKTDRAELAELDKIFGFSAAKAFGIFGANQSLRQSKASMGLLFEGDSLIYALASQKSLNPQSVLTRALPGADYAMGYAVPTLSKQTLEQLSLLCADNAKFAAVLTAPEFTAINGNAKQVDLSISKIDNVLQSQPPTVCLALSFEDLGKAMAAFPELQVVIANVFSQKETIGKDQVNTAPMLPPLTMSPIHLIQTADQRLVLTNIPEAKQAAALINGTGMSLLENNDIAVLGEKLGKNALFAGYENYKSVMKFQAAYQRQLLANMPDGALPPEVFQLAILETFSNLIKQMDMVFAAQAKDNVISCDIHTYSILDFEAMTKMIRELK